MWGPSEISSLGDSRYYVTFIDDSSRRVWTYFLKHKSDVFFIFKTWKAMVENEKCLKVKSLRLDNDNKYVDGESKRYCADNVIVMVKTIPGTPQENGVAERMNKILNERARSMRLHVGLPKMFWTKAINKATYLINRSPTTSIDFKLPEEVWSGKQVNLYHLEVFDCMSYLHINAADRSKLDPKSKKCYFLGYGSVEIGYRFWDDQNKKIVKSKDVIFNEKVPYKNRTTVDSERLESDESKKEKTQFISFPEIETKTTRIEDLNTTTPEKPIVESEELVVETTVEPDEVQRTPPTTVNRSTRTI